MAKPSQSQLGLFEPKRAATAEPPPPPRQKQEAPECGLCGGRDYGSGRVHTSLTNTSAHETCVEKAIEMIREAVATGRFPHWPLTPEQLRRWTESL
jgi:hypothetical protein